MPYIPCILQSTAAGNLHAHDGYALDVVIANYLGEFFGIIGHTGSGKSTLLQHMGGIMPPEAGTVIVDGYDFADKKQRIEGRKKVGLVFQYPEYQLFEETVAKDIAFGPKNMKLEQEEIDRRVRRAMELVGLDWPPSLWA